MRQGAIFSAVFHAALALLIIFGLPIFNDPKKIEDQPIVLEMVQIAEKSNPRPNPAPLEAPRPTPQQEVKPAPAPPPPPAPPPTPTPPQVAERAPTSTPAPKPPEPKPEVAKPEPVPTPKPEVKKPEPPKPEPKVAQTPPPKRPDPPKKAPPKEDPIAAILKNLAPTKPAPSQPDQPPRPQQQAAVQPAAPPSLDQVVTRSEQDAVKEKIRPCWYFDAGAIDASKWIVTIRAQMAPDGRVLSAQVMPSSQSGPAYSRAAEAARRAVLNPQCQPLPLPAAKYNQWKELDLNFNPQDMMG